jgi:hypothetical protein
MIACFKGYSIGFNPASSKLTLLKILVVESCPNFKVKFLMKAHEVDFSENFMVTTNISPSQNIKKTDLAFSFKHEKIIFIFF